MRIFGDDRLDLVKPGCRDDGVVAIDDRVPGEDHIVCGHGNAVRPAGIRTQVEGDAKAIFADEAVLRRREFHRQGGHGPFALVVAEKGSKSSAVTSSAEAWFENKRTRVLGP